MEPILLDIATAPAWDESSHSSRSSSNDGAARHRNRAARRAILDFLRVSPRDVERMRRIPQQLPDGHGLGQGGAEHPVCQCGS